MIPTPRETHWITGHGGVRLHVPEWGDPDGLAIVLIHGWAQAHQCWARQLGGALDRFRLIAPDLRGHGASDKPTKASEYDHSLPWANDIAAILEGLHLSRPVLVGWSMGGWVVQDHLRHFGDENIGGIALVGSSAMTGKHTPPDALAQRQADADVSNPDLYNTDVSRCLDATIRFTKACIQAPLAADDLAAMVGVSMLCPPAVRSAARNRHEDYRPDLARLSAPGLVLSGAHERFAMSPIPEITSKAIPRCETVTYANSGHAPFWEETDAFNADLARFTDYAAVSALPAG